MARKNAFYAQSGGVTAVINASACGVLETARQHSDEIGKVYAGRNGIIGADRIPAPRRRGCSDSPYRWDIIEAPLSAVANQEKLLPPEFISADGFGITDAARRYLAPLIVGEAFPPFKNGLPDYVRLQNVATPKKLTRQFAV
jgi:hypothetical protein